MKKEQFAIEHTKYCNKMTWTNKIHRGGKPALARRCGRKLYDYLVEKKLTLDPAYNHRRLNIPLSPVSKKKMKVYLKK